MIKKSFATLLIILCIIVYLQYTSTRVHIIHRIDPSNTGDMVSTCSNYFFFPNTVFHDIYKVDLSDIRKKDFVIFSGGGLLNNNDSWNTTINNVLKICNNCYAWGVGLNLHTNSSIKVAVDFKKFKKIGIRDYNNNLKIPYLPCSSCMIPELKYKYEIRRKYGMLEHIHHKIPLDLPKVKNNKDIKEIIKYIGETECIITNTYHCYYFAKLMNKKVILYEKFSSKFNNLRHEPVMYSGNLNNDFNRTVIHPDFHNECIKLNKSFYRSFCLQYFLSFLKV